MATSGDTYGYFWNSVDDDRLYDATSFEKWLKKFFTSGVFNGDFKVSPSSGLTLSVSKGYANLSGKVFFSDSASNITIDAADDTNPRIDCIAIVRDDSARTISLQVLKGTPSSSPKVSIDSTIALSNAAWKSGGTGTKYYLKLAQVYVAAGATSITAANITDTRMKSNVCGYVTGTVKELDFSAMENQFDSWFKTLKDRLDENTATNLQAQIDEINENTEAAESEVTSMVEALFAEESE